MPGFGFNFSVSKGLLGSNVNQPATIGTPVIDSITDTGFIISCLVTPGTSAVTPSLSYGLTTGYGGTVNATEGSITEPTTCHFTVTGLTAYTTYNYQVVADDVTSENSTVRTHLTEYVNLMARITSAPNDTRKALIETTIKALKDSGVWAKLDCFYMFAAHDAQTSLLNWIKDAHNCTAIASPTFNADQGYTGNGSSTYLRTNYNPSSQAVNYAASSASMGCYIRTAPAASGSKSAFGNVETDGVLLLPQFNGTTAFFRLNSSSWSTLASTDQVGTWVLVKPNGTQITVYKNGVGTTSGRVTTAISNNEIYLLRRSDATPQYWDGQISCAFIGAALTEQEAVTLTGIIQTYLTAGNNTSLFFGDSVTFGAGASVTANRFSSVFSTAQGTMQLNYGVSGKTMCSHPTTPDGTSMYEHIADIPKYVPAYKYLFFEFGKNDAGSDTIFTPSRFETQYNAVIAAAFAKNWPASKIKLLTLLRRDDAKEDPYNVKLSAIAAANGVQLIDTASVLAADTATYMADALHPNDAGHAAMSAKIVSDIT